MEQRRDIASQNTEIPPKIPFYVQICTQNGIFGVIPVFWLAISRRCSIMAQNRILGSSMCPAEAFFFFCILTEISGF